jgi:hypothetical protein
VTINKQIILLSGLFGNERASKSAENFKDILLITNERKFVEIFQKFAFVTPGGAVG